MRIRKQAVVSSLLLALVLASYFFAQHAQSKAEQRIQDRVASSTFAASQLVPKITEKEKISNALVKVVEAQQYSSSTLAEWLDVLADKESGGRTDIKVLDVNGKYSYGLLQFQMGTWLSFGKAYGLETTPENIYDGELQKLLAYKMISDRYENWRHWAFTVQKKGGAGFPPQS